MGKIGKEELIISTLFRIDRLKQTINSVSNLSILEYLESYKYLIQVFNQATAADDPVLYNEKLNRLLNYSSKIIEFSNKGNHCLLNIKETEEILLDIQQCVQLLKMCAVEDQDVNDSSVENKNNSN